MTRFLHAIGEHTNRRLLKFIEEYHGVSDPEEELISETLNYVINKFIDYEERNWEETIRH